MNPSEYDKMFELEEHYWWFVGRRQLALELLWKSLGMPTPHVLDLGCGTGVVSTVMKSRAEVYSLDMSDLALAYCRKRGLTRCIRGDGAQLPIRSETLDGILGLDIFEHIESDERAFAEAFRVLRPGGALVLSVPAFRFLWGPHDVALHHFRRYTRAEMRDKLAKAGFEVERCSYSVFFLFPLVVLTRMIEKRRRGPAKASLPSVPGWLNRCLIGLQGLESSLIAKWRIDLPWGSSVVAVARKQAVTTVSTAEQQERIAA